MPTPYESLPPEEGEEKEQAPASRGEAMPAEEVEDLRVEDVQGSGQGPDTQELAPEEIEKMEKEGWEMMDDEQRYASDVREAVAWIQEGLGGSEDVFNIDARNIAARFVKPTNEYAELILAIQNIINSDDPELRGSYSRWLNRNYNRCEIEGEHITRRVLGEAETVGEFDSPEDAATKVFEYKYRHHKPHPPSPYEYDSQKMRWLLKGAVSEIFDNQLEEVDEIPDDMFERVERFIDDRLEVNMAEATPHEEAEHDVTQVLVYAFVNNPKVLNDERVVPLLEKWSKAYNERRTGYQPYVHLTRRTTEEARTVSYDDIEQGTEEFHNRFQELKEQLTVEGEPFIAIPHQDRGLIAVDMGIEVRSLREGFGEDIIPILKKLVDSEVLWKPAEGSPSYAAGPGAYGVMEKIIDALWIMSSKEELRERILPIKLKLVENAVTYGGDFYFANLFHRSDEVEALKELAENSDDDKLKSRVEQVVGGTEPMF